MYSKPKMLKPKLPKIKALSPLSRPRFDGPFTVRLDTIMRVVHAAKKKPHDWDDFIDGPWSSHDTRIAETKVRFFYSLDYEAPILPEDSERITNYADEFYDPEEVGPWSDYDLRGFCNGINNDLNRLWNTMGVASFLAEYLRRLREIPDVLKTYRPLIKKLEDDLDQARSRASFKELVYSREARRLPVEVLRIVGRFLAVR